LNQKATGENEMTTRRKFLTTAALAGPAALAAPAIAQSTIRSP
jgi:hypothetical protein